MCVEFLLTLGDDELHIEYMDIEKKIENGERLTREDGLRLFACRDIAWIGALADRVRQEKCGDIVYYNVM